MRYIITLLLLVLSLSSFSKNTEQRDAQIIKAITERVENLGMKIDDIEIRRAKVISEQKYMKDRALGALELMTIVDKPQMFKKSLPGDYENLTAEMQQDINSAETEKNFGYTVWIKCHFKYSISKESIKKMKLVVSNKGDVEISF